MMSNTLFRKGRLDAREKEHLSEPALTMETKEKQTTKLNWNLGVYQQCQAKWDPNTVSQ